MESGRHRFSRPLTALAHRAGRLSTIRGHLGKPTLNLERVKAKLRNLSPLIEPPAPTPPPAIDEISHADARAELQSVVDADRKLTELCENLKKREKTTLTA
jgi:NADPH:quinone reductase-like Zn-dependent oxidoreductase